MSNMSREWELDGETHRTADDAVRQLLKAKMGAHVAATDKYLVKLKSLLYEWVEEITVELDKRAEDSPSDNG